MSSISANGIQIEYDSFGDPSNPPILLIIGLGCQMIYWDEDLCKKLAEGGLYVIRFDNRDSGLSTKFNGADIPYLTKVFQDRSQGKEFTAPYTHYDMTEDSQALLDGLGIEKAHICGMSMGTQMAMLTAILHPSKTLSLITVYGSTRNPELPQPKPEALSFFMTPAPSEREACIDFHVNGWKLLSGSKFSFDEEWHRKLEANAFDRCFCPLGKFRQALAGMATSPLNIKPMLGSIVLPSLIVHGTEDPVVPLEGGKDIADGIKGSELMIIEGMGHDLPRLGGAWDQITDRIIKFCKKENP